MKIENNWVLCFLAVPFIQHNRINYALLFIFCHIADFNWCFLDCHVIVLRLFFTSLKEKTENGKCGKYLFLPLWMCVQRFLLYDKTLYVEWHSCMIFLGVMEVTVHEWWSSFIVNSTQKSTKMVSYCLQPIFTAIFQPQMNMVPLHNESQPLSSP